MKNKQNRKISNILLILLFILLPIIFTACDGEDDPTSTPTARISQDNGEGNRTPPRITRISQKEEEFSQFPGNRFKMNLKVESMTNASTDGIKGCLEIMNSDVLVVTNPICHSEGLAEQNYDFEVVFQQPGVQNITVFFNSDIPAVQNTTVEIPIEIFYGPAITIDPDPIYESLQPGDSFTVWFTVWSPELMQNPNQIPVWPAKGKYSVRQEGGQDGRGLKDCSNQELNKDSRGSCTVTMPESGETEIIVDYYGFSESVPVAQQTLSLSVDTRITPEVEITSMEPTTQVLSETIEIFVSVTSSSETAPSGIVDINAFDIGYLCTLSLKPDGTGSCSAPVILKDLTTATAMYSGDAIHHIAISDPFDFNSTVWSPSNTNSWESPSITIITQILPAEPKKDEWVTVIVTVTLPDGSTPEGTVNITGADTTCTIDLTDGKDRCSVRFNSTGGKTLLATYSGTTGVGSSQATFSVKVERANPIPTPDS